MILFFFIFLILDVCVFGIRIIGVWVGWGEDDVLILFWGMDWVFLLGLMVFERSGVLVDIFVIFLERVEMIGNVEGM